MRIFKCRPFGEEVDLDNPETYEGLPKTVKELREMMLAKIGFAYCYTEFWHKDLFDKMDKVQRNRIKLLVKNFTENEKQYWGKNGEDAVLWYQEQIFLFEDEIENMC